MEIDCVKNPTIHGSKRIVLDIRAASMSSGRRIARRAKYDLVIQYQSTAAKRLLAAYVRTGRIICVALIDRYAVRPGYIESDDRSYREVEACESKAGLLTCVVMDVRLLQPIARTVAPSELAGAPRCAVEHTRLQPVI
jgi:hypothetical protein